LALGLGYPGRWRVGAALRAYTALSGIPRAARAGPFWRQRRNPFGFLPEPAGLVLAAETAIEEPQVVAGRDIAGITGQGLTKARLRLLPAALQVIRET